jgi:hypothetical protein
VRISSGSREVAGRDNKIINIIISIICHVKVKQSRYRPGVAQRVPGS